ncbi:MAG: DUF3137 domain-containing protein [Clostridiales bacterium]|nr:DUF3137 domain-containing protein [Clostridiales bacterium]
MDTLLHKFMEEIKRFFGALTTGYSASDFHSKMPQSKTLSDDELSIKLLALAGKIKKVRPITYICFTVGVAALSAGRLEMIPKDIGLIVGLPVLACAAFFIFWGRSVNEDIRQLVSQNIVKDMLSETFTVKSYEPFGKVDRSAIRASALIDDWDNCSGNNLVQGTYRGVDLSFSNLRIYRSGVDKSQKTLFNGQWLTCKLKIELPVTIRLRERSANNKRMRSDVETENAFFNEKYQILTLYPNTANHILTPQFMETIIKMNERANTRIFMSFKGDTVYIALHNTSRLFEVNPKEILSGTSIAEVREHINENIKYITNVVDELLLDDYLFDQR